MKKEIGDCTVSNQTKGTLPRVPFARIKNEILGETYQLSIALVTPPHAKKINIQTRNKDYIPNVLSFSLSKTSGEIILCPSEIKKQTKEFQMTATELLIYMVIHGCLHLKGYDHSSRMDKQEVRYLTMFAPTVSHGITHHKNNHKY